MKRTAPDRTTSQPKPVQRLTVKEGNLKARITLVILAVVVAVAAFAVGMHSLTSVDTGWRQVEATSSGAMNCSQDFQFDYYLGGRGASAVAELKAVTALYTQAAEHAHQVFNSQEVAGETNNLFVLNRNPNTPIQVDALLYQAFQQVESSGSRFVYMGPALAEYTSLFFCNEDWETEGFDPYQNQELRSYLTQLATFAGDDQSISVKLLGDNTLQLNVSEEYAAFARENGVTNLVDFAWTKNAFIIDYMAQVMTEKGYTRGAISSYDGFVRCLGEEGLQYSFNLYDSLPGGLVCQAAQLSYAGNTSLVHLHGFPINTERETNYYQFRDGTVRTAYLDMNDGLCKAAVPTLIATSAKAGCAEMLLDMLPLYARDELDQQALLRQTAQGVYPLYIQEKQIITTSPGVTISKVLEGYRVTAPEEATE